MHTSETYRVVVRARRVFAALIFAFILLSCAHERDAPVAPVDEGRGWPSHATYAMWAIGTESSSEWVTVSSNGDLSLMIRDGDTSDRKLAFISSNDWESVDAVYGAVFDDRRPERNGCDDSLGYSETISLARGDLIESISIHGCDEPAYEAIRSLLTQLRAAYLDQ